MNRFTSIKKKLFSTSLLLCAILPAIAQEAATSAAPGESSNLLAILLTVSAIVLAFVIWGMGQVLISVSKLALEKYKNGNKLPSVIFIIGLSVISQTAFAQTAEPPSVVADIPNYGGLTAGAFYAFVAVIAIEVAAILFLAFSIRRVFQELLPEKAKAPVKSSKFSEWWSSLDKKVFTKAVAVEKEADILIDHDYDGIQELDNSLPPWWKYGFYATIFVAIFYLGYYHAFGIGKNPTQEYLAEMEKARVEKEAYEANNKDKVDENNIPMADAAGIAAGKEIYANKCWPCHGKAGEGGAGPNLTDDYWLHKGSLNDIYHSIKVGYPDKGMQSWVKEFTPIQMSYIASYIKTLHGTNPPGARAPQGDLFTEKGSAPAPDAVK
ncbi:cytochrome C oxidase subunit III [Terrimonas sp.]|uniref:cbb3-type cytochrome c oxidase N-terminal domain-containing protein n=1 Tax=Terrimonas sp. TaxID=1914338 RepID=UPI000D51BDAF|nr:cbb3-type cytochrome c oxidase N-terminal domain-containing protein [Terrimonas sp.]PVD52288.1 cytochrome C oxidase subunit III [Terrimonas sp.]